MNYHVKKTGVTGLAVVFCVVVLMFFGCADMDMGDFSWDTLSFPDGTTSDTDMGAAGDVSDTSISDDSPSLPPGTSTTSFEKVMGLLPSVVMIEVQVYPTAVPDDETHREFYETPHSDPTQPVTVFGAGIIIDETGSILTTAHLVAGADEITIAMSDGTEYPAAVTGTYDLMDIAVLSISDVGATEVLFSPAAIGDPDTLSPGDWVGIVGNPFGLRTSLTVGVVSALNRRDINPRVIGEYIQIDAAVNPGLSGGPLVNHNGEVVGVVSGYLSPAEGIGFAIPIDDAVVKATEIITSGYVASGWIGVTVQEMTPELSRIFQREGDTGVLVVSVEERSPGDLAGILSGDIIVKFGTTDIKNGGDFDTIVMTSSPGSSYNVELIRGGQPMTVVVPISERYGGFSPDTIDVITTGTDLLDLFVVDVPEDISTDTGMTEGVLILNVAGDLSTLKTGDIILSVNRRPVNDRISYLAALAGVAQDESALLLIHRNTETFFVTREIRNR